MRRLPLLSCTLVWLAISAGCGAPSGPAVAPPAADPPPAVVSDGTPRTDTWTFSGRPGLVTTTPTHRVFTTLGKSDDTDRIVPFLSAVAPRYLEVAPGLAWPSQPLEVYVMRTREEWSAMCRAVLGTRDSAVDKVARGGVSIDRRAFLYWIGRDETLSIAAHEGWHQFVQSTFTDPLPLWVDEGIGTYMEGFRWSDRDPRVPVFLPWANVERFDALREASIAAKLMTLRMLISSSPAELLAMGQSEPLTYYGQVWALTMFLLEGDGGRHALTFRRMISDAHAGRFGPAVEARFGERTGKAAVYRRRGTEAFVTYIDGDIDAVDASYRAFIDRITRTGAKNRIVVGEAPV